MSSMSKRLRNLNLQGLDKATALAVANHIDQLEKELGKYKRAEAAGKLLLLDFVVGDDYYIVWSRCPHEEPWGHDGSTAQPCYNCPDAEPDKCGRYYEVRHYVWKDISDIFRGQKEVGKTIFKTKKQAQAACDRLNGKKKAKNTPSISRTDMHPDKVERLRKSDRDYYAEHKEEVNKKDRDKYHQLHPNARYYKPRKPKTDMGHQMTVFELLEDNNVQNSVDNHSDD